MMLFLWALLLGQAVSSGPRRLRGLQEDFNCSTVCPQELIDQFSDWGRQSKSCGPDWCLPFLSSEIPEYQCLCPAEAPCLYSMGPWIWDLGPTSCPFNRTSGRCDFEAAGRAIAEGRGYDPGLEAVECRPLDFDYYGYSFCMKGAERVGHLTECTTTTTTTTAPACTPHLPGLGELTCPISSSLERFSSTLGACRGASPNDYCDSYFQLAEADLTKCQELCENDAECSGVSFATGRCELWTREIGAVDESQDFTCFKKQDCELMPSGWNPYSECGTYTWPSSSGPACDLTCPEAYSLHCIIEFTDRCEVTHKWSPVPSTAYVTKSSGCGGSRCEELYAECCSCRRVDLLFEPADGDGQHQACRGKDPADNNSAHFTLHQGVQNLEECKQLCMNSSSCQGIEFSAQRCEVWTRPQGIQAIASTSYDITCLRFISNLPSSQTCTRWEPLDDETGYTCLSAEENAHGAVLIFAAVDGGQGRACRGQSAEDNSANNYEVVTGIQTVEECRSQCFANRACKGFEFSMGRCEVWTSEVGSSIALEGFACMRLEAAFAAVDGGLDKACRGSNPSDNSASYYAVAGMETLEACQGHCLEDRSCRGIEYSAGRCEKWSTEIGASIDLAGFECQRLGGPPAQIPWCPAWEKLPSSANGTDLREGFKCI